MTGTPLEQRTNRVHWFAGRLHEVLDEVTAGGVRVAALSGAEAGEVVAEITRAQARLDALKTAALARADVDEVASEVGATSTAAWLMHRTQTVPGEAHRLVALARRFDSPVAPTGHPHDLAATRTALAAGDVDADRAAVVVGAVDALPTYVDTADRVRAEEHLVAEAGRLHLKHLKRVARHLLVVVDPAAADRELQKKVEREEAEAVRRTALRLWDDGRGVCHGSFRIPTLQGAMLAKYLDALISPKLPTPIAREAVDEEGRAVQRHPGELLGEAFCHLLERIPVNALPKAAGLNATVVVTMELDKLLAGIGVATLDTGHHLSPGEARRLACHAGIVPAVLGTASEILDLGRKARFHTPAQRLALAVRDKTCTTVGCDRPAAWCHAHHDIPFSQGGRTDVTTGRLLCPRHHTLVHHPSYAVGDVGDGKILITRTSRRRQ